MESCFGVLSLGTRGWGRFGGGVELWEGLGVFVVGEFLVFLIQD